ncbi:PREDICTED: ladinin-1 [Lipotes vexillifer]|uniref:Ladinin-1 n=1 Tax=Lipotes vexillifer TaxID=118797 RepID=A0A340X880_LIPVE|nr:PREDICTED: ladinin-1 [Lipotes vexillifer]
MAKVPGHQHLLVSKYTPAAIYHQGDPDPGEESFARGAEEARPALSRGLGAAGRSAEPGGLSRPQTRAGSHLPAGLPSGILGAEPNWAALSSLARQWTLEDKEEQERERRRRHRSLSSTADDEVAQPAQPAQDGDAAAPERLPSVEEMEVSPRPPLDSSGEDVQAVLRARQERRQRQREAEVAQAPVQEQLDAEEEDSAGTGQAGQLPSAREKELGLLSRRRLSREQRSSWVRGEESLVGREPACSRKGGSEKPSAPEKTLAPEKSLDSKEVSTSGKTASPEKVSVSQKIAVLEKRTISGKTLVLEKTSVFEKLPSPGKTSDSEERRTSEKAAVFEKTPAPETRLAPARAVAPGQPRAQEQPASAQSPSTPKGQERAGPKQEPPSSAGLRGQGAERPAGTCHLPPITLQMKIPSKEDEADTPSPTQATYSSSLKRSSPRTISFRMSPRRDHSEAALTRSSSMRIPASSFTLGQKLERYHTAVQRSESVRSPGPSRAEFLVAPVDVASKRHLFEKELVGQGREGPASSRKENLRLSGVVTSRLNLWISKTQESGDGDPQEVQKESAAARRIQWRKKADSTLDAEVRAAGVAALRRRHTPSATRTPTGLCLHSPLLRLGCPNLGNAGCTLRWLRFPTAVQAPTPLNQQIWGLWPSRILGPSAGLGTARLSSTPQASASCPETALPAGPFQGWKRRTVFLGPVPCFVLPHIPTRCSGQAIVCSPPPVLRKEGTGCPRGPVHDPGLARLPLVGFLWPALCLPGAGGAARPGGPAWDACTRYRLEFQDEAGGGANTARRRGPCQRGDPRAGRGAPPGPGDLGVR